MPRTRQPLFKASSTLICGLCKNRKECMRKKSETYGSDACKRFTIPSFLYCTEAHQSVVPLVCAYRYYNDARNECKKCLQGKHLTRWYIERGVEVPKRKSKWSDLYNE